SRESGPPCAPRGAVRSSTLALAPCLQCALHLPLRVALHERAALVAHVLASGERELDLDAAVLEVEACPDERQAFLAHLPVQPVDLPAVEEELPGTRRIVVRPVALVVHRDLGAVQPRLAVANVRVGLPERRPPGAKRLHLGAGENQPGLDPL